MSADNFFLGRGWSFPPVFNRGEGVQMLDGEDDIQSSLKILLSTHLGERVMQPEYGCNTDAMVFEPITTGFQTYMQSQIKNAILLYEPRIDLQTVDLLTQNASSGLILISVEYVVRATNSRSNLVYPFYINEGNNL
ncbi:GPW/gp25 family protein [Parafilimonas sp.]|uniref:GPW/gp25 family protein n=1 Tax=Parafilimonas sp. TaxID=1969739 RepID=UPI0039E2535A